MWGDVTFSHRAPESLHGEVLLGAGLERWRDSKWRIGLDHDAGAEPELGVRKGRQPWCLRVCVVGCCFHHRHLLPGPFPAVVNLSLIVGEMNFSW